MAVVGSRATVLADEAAAPSNEILVPGARRVRSAPKDPDVASTVVERDRLRAPGLGAAAALRGTPGTVVTELGGFGAASSVSLRGATAAQTPVYLGGVRVNDEVGGGFDFATVPAWFVERIEVYRGNAPLEADRLGIAGAIFIEPRRPDGERLEAGALWGSFDTRGLWTAASAGSAADGLIAGVGFGASDNDYAFLNSQGSLHAAGDDTSERRANIDATQLDVWLHGRRRIGTAQLSLLAHHGALERGVVSVAVNPTDIARERYERDLVAVESRIPFGEPGEWVEASSSALVSSVRVDDPQRELALGATQVDVTSQRVEHSLGVRLRPHPNWTIRPRVALTLDRLGRAEARSEIRREPPEYQTRRLDLRPAVAAAFAVPGTPVVLRALTALECTSVGRGALSLCSEAHPTGRLGASLRHGALEAFANFGRYVRTPALGERFGVSARIRGNARLVPEQGISAELGARHELPALNTFTDLVFFGRWSEELIVYRPTTQYVTPENLGRGRVLGLELASGIRPVRPLRLELAVTAMDGRDRSAGRDLANDVLPLQPRLVLAPSVEFQHRFASRAISVLSARARYVYQSSRYHSASGLGVLSEQSSTELEIEATLCADSLVARLRVDNVFDQRRFDVVGFPLPGRAVFATLEARL